MGSKVKIFYPINKVDISTVVLDNCGCSFGFVYDSARNCITSQNYSLDNTFAYGKYTFTVEEAPTIFNITVRISSEANYDYGLMSLLDTELSKNTTVDSNRQWFGSGSTTETTVSYTINTVGQHYITFKYRKDGSTSAYNDRFDILDFGGSEVEQEVSGFGDNVAVVYDGQTIIPSLSTVRKTLTCKGLHMNTDVVLTDGTVSHALKCQHSKPKTNIGLVLIPEVWTVTINGGQRVSYDQWNSSGSISYCSYCQLYTQAPGSSEWTVISWARNVYSYSTMELWETNGQQSKTFPAGTKLRFHMYVSRSSSASLTLYVELNGTRVASSTPYSSGEVLYYEMTPEANTTIKLSCYCSNTQSYYFGSIS